MKFAVLFVLTTLYLGGTAVFASPSPKRTHAHFTHVHFMQVTNPKTQMVAQNDPIDALRPPVGPTDSYYGDAPRW